jgi:hypothetical protein
VTGASDTVTEYNASSANVSGGGDTVDQKQSGDYVGLLGGSGYLINASGSGGTVATTADANFNLAGSDESVDLATVAIWGCWAVPDIR